jgi:hypothetical protein
VVVVVYGHSPCHSLVQSSLVYTPTIHKKRRRALRALFSDKCLQVRGLFLVNKSKEASTCRREAALRSRYNVSPAGKIVTEVSGGG